VSADSEALLAIYRPFVPCRTTRASACTGRSASARWACAAARGASSAGGTTCPGGSASCDRSRPATRSWRGPRVPRA